MKIFASNGSDLNLLHKLVGTDTWVKCRISWGPGLRISAPTYVQILDIYSDRVQFLYIEAVYVEGSIKDIDDPNSNWAIADIFGEHNNISIDSIKVLHPYEFLETWEIQSALEFAGYPKEFEGVE